MSKRRVVVIALGGTISSAPAPGGGVRPTLSARDLVDAVPVLASVAEVEVAASERAPVAGPQLDLTTLVDVGRQITTLFDDGCDGVVVTQGTDTLEETAFALDLLVGGRGPIAVTGAMRDPTLPGADGSANVLAAVTVVADGCTSGIGTVVVFGDEIHAARWVRKTHSTLPATFESVTGPLGWLTENRPRILTTPAQPLPRVPVDQVSDEVPPVLLLRAAIGDDGRVLDHAASLGYEGVVYEGFGGGHVHPEVAARLKTLAATMPVVLASRTHGGELLLDTYSFIGSERDLRGHGLLGSHLLDGAKARIALSFVLASGAREAGLAQIFSALD